MKYLFNNQKYKSFRMHLRNASTISEMRLWNCLKNSKLNARKFRRQYSVGKFVLDFYCPSERLAIEVDGKVHNNWMSSDYDYERDEYIKSQGIKVLRFNNSDIAANIEGVLQTIIENFQKS